MSKTYAPRTNLRVMAVQWTGYNEDEVRELLPSGITMTSDTSVLVVLFPMPTGGSLRMKADEYLVQNGVMFDVWPAHCFRSVFVEM